MNEEQILRTGFRQDKALCKTLRAEQTRQAETGQLQDSVPFHRPPAVLPPQLCLSHRSPPSSRSKNQTRMQRKNKPTTLNFKSNLVLVLLSFPSFKSLKSWFQNAKKKLHTAALVYALLLKWMLSSSVLLL